MESTLTTTRHSHLSTPTTTHINKETYHKNIKGRKKKVKTKTAPPSLVPEAANSAPLATGNETRVIMGRVAQFCKCIDTTRFRTPTAGGYDDLVFYHWATVGVFVEILGVEILLSLAWQTNCVS
jgi:hypothetical protein